MATDKIKVAVRVRPFNRREIELGTQCVIEMEKQQTIIHHPSSTKGESRKQPKTFAFDHCFWSFSETDDHYASQAEVYKKLGADILDNAFQGYNACIFAYGQTGSGKSYTMMGSEDNKGLIPRMCDSLFERVASETDPAITHKVEVSYMEIYNEKVHDLLDPKGTKQTLRVREHNILGPYVDGLSTLAVSKFEEINNLMTEGNKSRTVAATNMNNESSRSHAVFNITLTSIETDNQTGVSGEKVSKMSLVDLAGSERAVKTGAVAERLKEGSNINKSLTTLGLVISKLADQASGKAKDKFVPYRDSVLTWLLKDNLGGNSKTVMVATISPSADNYEETLSTLRYADRAKRIVNHAVVNEDPNARIIRELREEVEMLRDQLKHATQQEDVHERLVESEKLMKEMSQTWEEKLHRTEIIHQERQQALEKMGISVQASGIKVEKDKYYLVNLNADPSLNELLVYYLKDQTLIGGPDAPVEQDIQLSGLGIMPEHCIISIENCDIYITPLEGARTCVNGSVITSKTQLRHGDRVLWGNNHFFRVNCPKANTLTPAETPDHPIDYEFAREELMMKELSNDPIQSAVKVLERQHEEDKHNALEKQRVMYERQLQMLRNQMSPSTPYAPYSMGAFDPLGLGKLTPSGLPSPSMQSKMEKWARESNSLHEDNIGAGYAETWAWDELFKKSLAKLRGDIVRANALVREANFLSEEMGKQTEFKVTLQIPAANLSPNRKKGAFVSEPAILVKRKSKGSQVWSMEKLENKLIDMRELYEDCKEKGLLPLKEDDPPKGTDPFYESQENHNLIGVGNVFLEVLFHDVKLDYHVPIISQQGEVAGRLHVEVERTAGSFADRVGDAGADSSRDSIRGSLLDISENSEDSTTGRSIVVRVTIKAASGLPPSLSNFVFCQYTFWGYPDAIVVPPVVNPEYPATRKGKDRMTFKFDHVKDFVVNITEEFVEHCAEGALSIEVWGHRSAGFSNSKPGWEVDAQLLRSRSLADRWAELTRKIELWIDILELNEQGEYAPVEVIAKPDILTGGIFQLRQGQQRRVVVRVKPVQNSGTLPIICEAITSVAIGCICVRSKLQKPLDSYQEEDLTLLREKWSEALMRRREYLDDQIQKIINKQAKADQDVEREQSLIDQWVSLTEERNAVLVPAAGSGIPGAPADWDPPPGMEKHIPVIFLDLSADDMSAPITGENDIRVAGANSILPKEHGSKLFTLPIVKYCEKEVCATAAWDSSIHDSLHLNRVTPQNEHVYLILKASVRLTHPATMDLILRKRLIINVYKKQSITERIIKKIGRQDFLNSCGVTYEVVSNIPKASEDPEDRESLALMAASGEDAATSDGESYIEKYTRGVSAVESILTLDRLRQEVAMKELLAAQGRPLRKTASVPNIAHIVRMETSPTKLEDQRFAESACDLSLHSSCDNLDRFASRTLSTKESKPLNNVTSPVTNSFGLTRPTFLNLNFNLNLSLRQATSSKSGPLSAITPQSSKLKPMRTLLEEQRETRPLLYKEESEESGDEEEVKHHNGHESDEEFTEFASYKGTEKVSANEKLDISEIEQPEIAEKPLMQHSSTADSLVELQTKVGTPSIISSGYGSQVLSTTPVSSEDSASLRSCSVEETPDTDTAKQINNLSVDSEKTRLQSDESLQSKQSTEYSEQLLSETCDLSSVPEMPSEVLTNCHSTATENESSYSEYNDSLEQFKESIVSNTQQLNKSVNEVAETTEDKIPPATHSYSRSLSLEQQERRSKLAELQLETTPVRPPSCEISAGINGDDTDSQNSNPDETDDSTSVGSFESRSDVQQPEISVPSWLVVGESVMISPYNKTGAVAYVGPTEFAGGAWVGIELDTPTGKNDGSVNGIRYFQCKPRFGIFVRPDKLVIDKRGRAVRAARQATTNAGGKDGLWRSRSKGEGLSSIVDNSIRRSRSRGEGLSTLGTSSDNLRRSRGDGLSKLSEPHHEGTRNNHREGIDSTNKPVGSRNRK